MNMRVILIDIEVIEIVNWNVIKNDVERGHMYMMVMMSGLTGFVNDLGKIMYRLEFKLILKRNNNDRPLFRVNAGADAVAYDGNIDISGISWCVPSIDPGIDNRFIVQKGLNKKNNIGYSYYEKKTFYKNVPNANYFLFDLGIESGLKRPQTVIIDFEKKC